jgi:hypothetical protein
LPPRSGKKDQLVVSKMFLWYGRDFGPDDVAVMKWIAANMPTGEQANVNFFMLHVTSN